MSADLTTSLSIWSGLELRLTDPLAILKAAIGNSGGGFFVQVSPSELEISFQFFLNQLVFQLRYPR